MVRFAALILSLVGSLTLLGSAALAQPGNGFYNVTLANQVAGKTIVRGMVFSCDGAACTSAQGNSRPAIICASVARELGPVTAFRAGGESLSAEALAKCNVKAAGAGETKLARR
jgi:hypothetical protein